MTTRVVVQARDLGRYERALAGRFPAVTARALRQAGEYGVRMLQNRSRNIRDLRTYQNGWTYELEPRALWVRNTAGHAINVEKGRGAGKRMPPMQVILEWCLRHGMSAEAEWPVRRKIAEQGIAPRPVMGDAAQQTAFQLFMPGVVQDALVLHWDQALRNTR